MDHAINKKQQAKIILEEIEEYFQVNWSMEEYYEKAIIKALIKIEEQNKKPTQGDV